MVLETFFVDGPDEPATPLNVEPMSPIVGVESSNRQQGPLQDEASDSSSISNDAMTPSSSISPSSLRRSSALRRKSTSTRTSDEGDSIYYDISNRSSIATVGEQPSLYQAHQSLPFQQQSLKYDHAPDVVRRTMSVPLTAHTDHDDVEIQPLNITRRTHSLEDPRRKQSGHDYAGNVNDGWYFENALLHGLDSGVNQLQVYLLGHPPMDLPASYVVFLPNKQSGSLCGSSTIARYRCRYPDCEIKWRDEDEHKLDQKWGIFS